MVEWSTNWPSCESIPSGPSWPCSSSSSPRADDFTTIPPEPNRASRAHPARAPRAHGRASNHERSGSDRADQVGDTRRRVADVERTDAVLDGAVSHRAAIVLPKMLDPRLHEERPDVAGRLGGIVVHAPLDRAVTPAQPAHVAHGRREREAVARIDDVLHRDQYWARRPTSFVESIAAGLVELGYAPGRIKTERFVATGGR